MINDLLNKLAKQERDFLNEDIFAPYVKGGSCIRVKINGVVYQLKTPKLKKDGFGVFRAKDPNNAKLNRDAESYEISSYLEILPKVGVILVAKINDRWLAYPVNGTSFKQRFGVEPKLFSVLVADNVEILDTALARFDGANFWFDSATFTDGADRRLALRESIQAFNYGLPNQHGLSPEEVEAFKLAAAFHKEANVPPIERRLNDELNKAGATMDKYIERGKNIEVQWRDTLTKKTYTSVLKADDLSIVTAGICLSGGDKKFDMQSLVGVVREGEARHGVTHIGRGGMETGRYWEMYGNRNDDSYDDYEDDY